MPSLVPVEPDDDVDTIRAKLEVLGAQKAALLLPGEWVEMQGPSAYSQLHSTAYGLGVELAVVSSDGDVRQAATDQGFPAFSDPRAYRRWLAQRGATAGLPNLLRFARRPRFSAVGVALLVAAVGIAVVVGVALMPQVAVVLYPRTQIVSGSVEVRADPSASALDVSSRRAPARVSYVVVDVNEQGLTRGRLPSPEAQAVGTVTFANRQGGPAQIPTGTTVVTLSGVRFLTTADVTLGETAGSTARVAVQAVQAGETGNVDRLEINRVVGPLARQLSVLNEEPTVGGGQSSTPVIVEDDIARVRAQAADHARADAMARLQGDVHDDESLVLQTLEFSPLEEQLDRKVGDQVGSFNYRLKARVSGAVVSSGDVERIVRGAWRPDLPPGYFLPEKQLQILSPRVSRVDGRVVIMEVPVQSVAVAPVDAADVRERVRWRAPDEARRDLARSGSWAAEPRVAVNPSWFGRALRVKIALDLNEPKPPRA
jgi:hypothetical protein